ncbi:hypothetical protein PVK06_043558 [Gossypium arboreum]|uniref:DUF7745 domain-containing protein n=1 Tax=Gossypium arboreum TaxID=29729 RepID=A0ABR0MQI9_GOSAR|nr:hypothetical protein PVK06_043558 [Gossypium arboreum]
MAQFWNPAYSCFTLGEVDLVPTVEEYTTLLRCPRIQVNKAYSRAANVPTFVKKLMNITGMSEPWVTAQIQQRGDGKCIHWMNLSDLILSHPDVKKKVDIFALSIYGLVIFPKALRHIDEAITNLFDRLDKRITPVPAILAETFKSLSMCWRAGEGRFIGCAQLLLEEAATQRRDNISKERWMAILKNLKEEDIEWRAFWMVPDEILYRCGSFDWVPLLRIWRAVRYTPLLVLRQYKSIRHSINGRILASCPLKLEIIRQDFEKKSFELGRRIEQFEEEKMSLRLVVNVQKSEAEKLKKGKNKAEKDLDSLKTDYKKLCLSMMTVELGKTSEQCRQEIREEKSKADQWERKF